MAAVTEQALNAQDDRLHIPELARRARLRRVLVGLLLLARPAPAFAYYTRPAPPVELYRVEPLAQARPRAAGRDHRQPRCPQPRRSAGACARAAVSRSLVEPRQQVQKGALLATLDPRAADLDVRGARAARRSGAGAPDAGEGRARRRERTAAAHADPARQGAREPKRARQRAGRAATARRPRSTPRAPSASWPASRWRRPSSGKSLGQIRAPIDGRGAARARPRGRGGRPRAGAAVRDRRAARAHARRRLGPRDRDRAGEARPRGRGDRCRRCPDQSCRPACERIGIEPKREGGVVQYPVTLLVDNPDARAAARHDARACGWRSRARSGALSVHEAALRFSPEDASRRPAALARVRARVGSANELRRGAGARRHLGRRVHGDQPQPRARARGRRRSGDRPLRARPAREEAQRVARRQVMRPRDERSGVGPRRRRDRWSRSATCTRSTSRARCACRCCAA